MSDNGHLTIEQILKQADTEIRRVPCPEWGGTVYVRTISGDARDKFELRFADDATRVGARAALVGAAMCDPEGRFLAPTEAEVKALGAKASGPLDRCFDAVMEVNKMRARDVEELEKNLEATPDDDSG